MIELILFSIAFIGSLLAGLWDLKTTEIPDEIPTLMAVFGVFIWLVSGNLYGLALSVVFGLSFLGFGWLLYKAGQWGGGDAKMLSAIGFLLPIMNNAYFGLSFFFNLFLVGLAYMIVYSLALGFLNKGTFSRFGREFVKEKIVLIAFIALLLLAAITSAYVFIFNYTLLLELVTIPYLLFVAAFLVIFWKYSKIVENCIFKRKIPVAKLRIGDVLLESKQWDGVEEADLQRIKRSGKRFVTIKEGVRFGMVFPIALLVTYTVGNIIFLLIGM